MICYGIFAIILAGFGVLCYMQASNIHELTIRYDDKCNGVAMCDVSFVPDSDLVNPKIYY